MVSVVKERTLQMAGSRGVVIMVYVQDASNDSLGEQGSPDAPRRFSCCFRVRTLALQGLLDAAWGVCPMGTVIGMCHMQ